MIRGPSRTGLRRVKLPHPITAFTASFFVLFLYGAGVLLYDPVLNHLKVDRSWRIDVSRVGAGLIVLGGLLFLYLLRRAFRASSASRPGGIDITVISANPQRDVSANQVAAELRNALTDVYLSGPSVVPGESAPQDFLTEVRGAAQQARSFWGLLVAAVSLFSPRNAYRVSCTEQVDASVGAHGLTIEVSGLPRQEPSATTVWADTWPQLMRHAACHIAAYVLPRTKLSRHPPWRPWHGINIPPELFYSFHEARRLVRAGRLEEALHHFDEAIMRDPLNPYIRIERATAQDQLGLWIDALASYVDVVTIESWFDRPVWKRYRRVIHDLRTGTPSPFARGPNGKAALQIARYRAVCSLAAADRLATQWTENAASNSPDQESRDERQPARRAAANLVIDRLRPLVEKYADLMMYAHCVEDSQQEMVQQQLKDNHSRTLRRVFQFAALEESAAIRRDFSWYHPRRWTKLPISQAAIRILPVWAALQYHYVECVHALDKSETVFQQPLRRWMAWGGPKWLNIKYSIRWLKRIDKSVGWRAANDTSLYDRWPPKPEGISDLVSAALGRQKNPLAKLMAKRDWYTVKRGWLEHYNAACAFAVSIMTPELRQLGQIPEQGKPRETEQGKPGETGRPDDIVDQLWKRHGKLVRRAVNELTRAVVATDSQFAAGRSVWLRRGDQDLDDLRLTPEYTVFVERYLPDTSPILTPPPNPTPLVVKDHISNITISYAKLRGLFWREHAEQFVAETTELDAEIGWWRLLHEVCDDYWDWRTRYRLIYKATKLAVQLGRFDPNMLAVNSALVRDRQHVTAQKLSDSPVRCESGRRVGKFERQLYKFDNRLRPSKHIKIRTDDTTENSIERLDFLGKWLSESRLQLIEERIGKTLSRTAFSPISEQGGKRLVSDLIEAWEAIADWIECETAIDDCGSCLERMTRGVSGSYWA